MGPVDARCVNRGIKLDRGFSTLWARLLARPDLALGSALPLARQNRSNAQGRRGHQPRRCRLDRTSYCPESGKQSLPVVVFRAGHLAETLEIYDSYWLGSLARVSGNGWWKFEMGIRYTRGRMKRDLAESIAQDRSVPARKANWRSAEHPLATFAREQLLAHSVLCLPIRIFNSHISQACAWKMDHTLTGSTSGRHVWPPLSVNLAREG